MSATLQMFRNSGPEKFSRMMCLIAPYVGTIDPTLLDLKPGRAEVRVPFRRDVTNHLGSFHAIAMCHAAELAGGMMTDVSIPAGARWITKGMSVSYLAKAKTDITAIADGSKIDWSTAGDKVIHVDVSDAEGKKIVIVLLTMNVKLAE